MFKKFMLLFLSLSILPFAVYAQSTGKIAGQVIDQATGEPLPGVNITVDNTLLGANTDFDGYFVILNVPVGVYTIRASFIGFQEVAMENIRVSAGITTDLSYELNESPLELGEVIVITGQRPLVEKNITQSYSLINAEQIDALPVRGVNAILDLQASVVVQDGNVHIRGGRSNETGYYLDGASINNPVTNTRAVHIIQDAVEELQVLAGGYTAEFGGANSGIVRAELKTGTSDYHFSVDAQTDNFVKSGEKFLGTYSYGETIVSGTVSGPLVSKNIRFFLAAENWFARDDLARFSEGYEFNDLVDTNPRNSNVTDGNPDVVSVGYLDGYTPYNNFNQLSFNGTVLFDFKPLQVRLSGVYTHDSDLNEAFPMTHSLNTRHLTTNTDHMLFSGKFTYILSATSFINLKLDYFKRDTETEDPWFGTDWRKWSDSLAVADYTGGAVEYRTRWREQYDYELLGIPFERDGSNPGAYTVNNNQYYGGTIDYKTQFNKYNEMTIGGDFKYYTLRRYSMSPLVMSIVNDNYGGIESNVPERDVAEYEGNIYGYDKWGNELNDDTFNGPRNPTFASFYVQDKIEFKDLVINAGLRFDYFDTDDSELRDPTNPKIDNDAALILESEWIKKDPMQFISPRLGISFPITQKTVFYAQYGKFIQMPELNNVYYNNRQYGRQIVEGGFFYLQPIGAGMDPMRTTQYEIGFRQQIGDVAAFDVAGFYKNIKGYPSTVKVTADPTAQIGSYFAIANGDFATTRGLEFKLTLRRTARLQAQLNYTVTAAEGTGSGETTYYGAVYRGTQAPTITSPLDFEQTHRGSINLDYRWGVNDGGPVLERLGTNVVFNFSSGHPFTYAYAPPGGQSDAYTAGVDYMNDPRSREAREAINSSITPWNFNMDLRLDKSFNIMEQLSATVYVRVTNLLNSKNVINVYQNTGSATDDGYISDPSRYASNVDAYGPEYLALYGAINSKNGESYMSQIGNELYSHPRQIFLGIKLNY